MNTFTIYFECDNCTHIQSLKIKSDKCFYQIEGQYLDEDKKTKTETCEKCSSASMSYHTSGDGPSVLGGTKGYVSMERYQQLNPDNYKRKEEELETKMADRHRKRVLDKLNKEMGGGRRQDRHEGYGKGQGEERLRND